MYLWPLAVFGSYLLGSFPTALFVGRIIGHNPTKEGSKNPGATNVFRISGYKAAAAVLAGDVLKGLLPVLVVLLADGDVNYALICGAAAVVGHIFPVFARFRGGKGVATYGGMLIMANPLVGLFTLLTWFVTLMLSKKSSLGAMVALPLSILAATFYNRSGWEPVVLGGVGVLIVIRHLENIKRLFKGEESSIG